MSFAIPQLNTTLCWRCGDCVLVCTQHAVSMPESQLPRIDDAACIYCGDCEDACPAGAISLPLWIYTAPKEK